jgi:hypothetical protein
MLYLYHEIDVDYLVVKEMINIKNCLITIACLVQVQTYDDNYTNMAKTCLKVLKDNCCRLMSPCHLKPLHV